jgi:hypothetical protein
MQYLIIKYLATAAIIVLVSEIAKASGRIGGLILALPLVTILTLVWMHVEKAPAQQLGILALYTFWYVIPTLPMFLLFPYLLSRTGFWTSLVVSILCTLVLFGIYAFVLKRFGIELL